MTSVVPDVRFREIDLLTGVRMRYVDIGPTDGPALLLLHGYSDSWFSFSRIVDLLPSDVRIIIPDQRGHGESERPPDGYGPVQLAADAICLLQMLHIKSAIVVGHSLGSFVGQHMGSLAPDLIDHLVLVGSAADARKDNVRALVPVVETLTDPVDQTFVRDFQMSTLHRAVPREFFEKIVEESCKLPARVWKAVLNSLLRAPALPNDAAIRCPVTLFWGDKDAIFGHSDQVALLRRIPHARLVTFRDVGHDPQWEVPEEFVDCLVSSLRVVESA